MSKAGFSPYDIGLCDTINETNHLLQRIRTGDHLFFPYRRELDWNNPGLPLPLQANLMGYCYRITDIRYGSYSSREVYRLPSLTGKNIMDQTIRELIELHCLPLSFYSADANKVFTLPFPIFPVLSDPFHSIRDSRMKGISSSLDPNISCWMSNSFIRFTRRSQNIICGKHSNCNPSNANIPHLSPKTAPRFDGEPGCFFLYFLQEGKGMAVLGEQYFLMMMHMHFLCLMAAKKALPLPLRPGKALLACLFASLYSLFSLMPALPLQNTGLTLSSMVMTAVIAFGKSGFAACLPMGLAGLCFAGVCHFLAGRGLPPLLCMGLCTLLCLLYRPGAARQHTTLLIRYQGKHCRLPAFLDTGNHLRHPILSLPVIIAPEEKLQSLLPAGFHAADITTLPAGFTLVSASTINGKSLLMAFHPDEIRLGNGRITDALIAVTPRPLPQALLPHNLQPKEVRAPWKRKRCSGKKYPPSVNG